MTLRDIAADIEAEEAQARADAIDMLWLYDKERAAESKAKGRKDNLGEKLRSYLQLHEGERLWDGERGFEGYMQSKRGARECDLRALYEGNKALFEQLLYTGCLEVNEKALKTAGALVGGVERYMTPYGTTQSLQVVKVKE